MRLRSLCLSFILLSFLPPVPLLRAQSDPWAPRGVRAFLVNYNAMKGDAFFAALAARRFVLIDESAREDIRLLHAQRPGLPILHYKDIVACYPSMDEWQEVNRDEWAFLHASEPSAVTVWSDGGDSVTVTWAPDRRGEAPREYRLATLRDSLGSETALTGALSGSIPQRVLLPPDARYLLVRSVAGDGGELRYGLPAPLSDIRRDDAMLWPDSSGHARSGDTVRVHVRLRHRFALEADSVVLIGDWDRNNRLDSLRERLRMRVGDDACVADTTFSYVAERSNCGFEYIVEYWRDGRRSRYPRRGAWSSNANHRLVNDYYGFHVMNVCNATWRRAWVRQVLAAFARDGYTGLFEDDCWYRVENYGVDAYPPVPYDEHSWRRGLYDMLDSIRIGIAPRPAYFNGLYTVASDSLLLHTVGGMTEGFAYTHWSGLVPGDSWRNQCNRGLSAMHRYGREWMALAGAPYDNADGRLYAWASYMLTADSLGMYATATDYQEFAHYPEYDIPLGKALEHAALDIDELAQGSGNTRWYRREFEHGTVIVNPSSTALRYDDARGRPVLSLLPGTTVDGGGLRSVASTDSVPARSARVWLNLPPGEGLYSPTLLEWRVEPAAVPADGSTPCRLAVRAVDSSTAELYSDATLPLRVVVDASPAGGPPMLELRPRGAGTGRDALWYDGEFTIPVGAPPDSARLPVLLESPTGLCAVRWMTLRIVSADSGNLVRNYSFEIDANRDGIPDTWRPYVKGFDYEQRPEYAHSGSRAVHVRNDSLSEMRGVYARIDLLQSEARPLELSGWSRAVGVSGASDNDYALYVDAWYDDGTPLYGQTARFATGTHDWEYGTRVIQPARPIHHLLLYVLFRRHTGEAWFDHLALRAPTSSALPEATPRSFTVSVYPQPLRDHIAVHVGDAEGVFMEMTLSDISGVTRRVLHRGIVPAASFHARADLASLPSGLYLLHITGARERRTHPVLLVK